MSGIADDEHPSLDPGRHGLAVEQRPAPDVGCFAVGTGQWDEDVL